MQVSKIQHEWYNHDLLKLILGGCEWLMTVNGLSQG